MNVRCQRILFMGCFLLGSLVEPALSQEAIWSADSAFRIPYEVDPSDRARLAEIQLHYSSDNGQTWKLYRKAPPTQSDFSFAARGDGEYWFTVRTVDREGRIYPPTLDGAAPQLRVFVDTTAPEVTLRAYNPVGNKVGVSWEIIEENLDEQTIRLEFKTVGSSDWYPVSIDRRKRGNASWELGVGGPIEIRLRALDQANNEGLKTITMGSPTGIPAVAGSDGRPRGVPPIPGSGEFQVPTRPSFDRRPPESTYPPARDLSPVEPIARSETSRFSSQQGSITPPDQGQAPLSLSEQMQRRPAQPTNVKLVNSKLFGINYTVDDLGKSGIGSVKLYFTLDGRNWEYYGEDDDLESPFPVEVNSEGTYGFILAVRNGAGIGDDAPVTGDPPQAWVEVDLTPPEIELQQPQPGTGSAEGILSIAWYVQDRNLAAKSIKLEYSETTSGPWKTIRENINNNGWYQWRMPEEVPFKFHVRIESRDRAGNVGRQVTDRPVIVDLSRPKARVLGVEPSPEIRTPDEFQ